MNLGTLRTQVSNFLGDPDQTRFTAAQYLAAINRSQEQFGLDTKALWKDTSWTTVAGTATYALPSDFQWEDFVTYDGYEISPISRHELQRRNPGDDWTDETGSPTNYIIDPEEARKTLRVYPVVQEIKTLSMRYFPLPASLAADADIPLNSSALMAQFHIGLAAYAAWLLLMNEEQTPAIIQKKRELERIYADMVSRATETFKNTASAPLQMRGRAIWS